MIERRVVYVSGTRADFGLAEHMLHCICAHPHLELSLLVTGMHRVPAFGSTERLVEESGLPIGACVDMLFATDTRAAMAKGIGVAILGITDALERLAPHVVLLLGDRGEMLAAAIAAVHLGIPVAHCHGGEVSGTLDEPVRHAISKLAHLHFTATTLSRDRLIRMGERPSSVFVTGAPGLDALVRGQIPGRIELCAKYGLDTDRPWALILYHPDTGTADAAAEIDAVLAGLEHYVGQWIVFEPNSDAGYHVILDRIEMLSERPGTIVLRNVPRRDFLGLMAQAQVMVGNSSSGLIEAPTLGVPVVNVGRRQELRERGDNVLDVAAKVDAVADAVVRACEDSAFLEQVQKGRNPYGDGYAGKRIAEILATVVLDPELIEKRFTD